MKIFRNITLIHNHFCFCLQSSYHCLKSVQIRSFFWSVFSCIRTEYGEILRISPYSVRMRENTDQKKLRIWTLFTQCKKILLFLFYNFSCSCLQCNISWSSYTMKTKTSLFQWFVITFFKTDGVVIVRSTRQVPQIKVASYVNNQVVSKSCQCFMNMSKYFTQQLLYLFWKIPGKVHI